MKDAELVQAVLERDEAVEDDDPSLSVREREAFASMLSQLGGGRDLSDKQRAWVSSAAVRLGVLSSAPAANVFSSLSAREQREHRERASGVQLPWEASDYRKPLKPTEVEVTALEGYHRRAEQVTHGEDGALLGTEWCDKTLGHEQCPYVHPRVSESGHLCCALRAGHVAGHRNVYVTRQAAQAEWKINERRAQRAR